MTKNERLIKRKSLLSEFDPGTNGLFNNGIFGLPFSPAESEVILIPVPWEVTVSFREGTSIGPEMILETSQQIDLYKKDDIPYWERGYAMIDLPRKILSLNNEVREKARYIIGHLSHEKIDLKEQYQEVNDACEVLKSWVYNEAKRYLDEGKKVGLVGGEHSSPLGLIEILSEKHESFGILQIDAHCDLRESYEGFKYSHASIMFNALKLTQITKLVSVGIRDFSEEESNYVKNNNDRIEMFTSKNLSSHLFYGAIWDQICNEIISKLPKKVYISFDIDGLNPFLCPGTGTPVPGGIDYEEALFLLRKIKLSGREIIGFDLCEIAPSKNNLSEDWNGIVGAHILFELCNLI